MKIGKIISIIQVVWGIVKELLDFYKHLEEKYHWGQDKGAEIKKEIRDKKRKEFDEHTVKTFTARGLPAPSRETQAYVRELVHEKVSGKKVGRGKTRRTA